MHSRSNNCKVQETLEGGIKNNVEFMHAEWMVAATAAEAKPLISYIILGLLFQNVAHEGPNLLATYKNLMKS